MVNDKDHPQATGNKAVKMIPSVIKFDIPDAARDFIFFVNLPKEIRHMIWEAFLMTPGIQFVKLQSVDANSDWISLFHPPFAGTSEGDSETGPVLSSDSEQRTSCQTCLVPTAACRKADFSHYKSLRRDLKTLENTCHESREVVKFLCNRGGALKAADGKMVSLGKSHDAIFLDYLPPRLYKTNCTLTSVPNLCSGLEHLKRIAVKFCHHWRERTLPCGNSDDGFEPDPGYYPTHLYQFLARHFPNLQEVFFVDYLMVAKIEESTTSESDTHAGAPRALSSSFRFQAGNRVFHEVNEDEWIVNKKILGMTEWLRSSYVHYATSSKLCKHKDPKAVRFAILGCQWQITAPVQRDNLKRKFDPKSDSKPRQMRRVTRPNCRKHAEAGLAFNVSNM